MVIVDVVEGGIALDGELIEGILKLGKAVWGETWGLWGSGI